MDGWREMEESNGTCCCCCCCCWLLTDTHTIIYSILYSGVTIYQKTPIRADTTKIIATAKKATCPRIDQIRKIQIHNIASKGPNYARSLGHKVLGNQEFCLQIDAHMEFVKDWDSKVKQEWVNTDNEFGIISTVPAGLGDKDDESVPRMCAVDFQDIGIPVRKTEYNRYIYGQWITFQQ